MPVLSRGVGCGGNRRVRRGCLACLSADVTGVRSSLPSSLRLGARGCSAAHLTRLQSDGQVQPNRLRLSPMDGLVPTRRTCMSMPGAKSVMVFACTRVLDEKPHHNSQMWLKGTFTG